jgi:methylmalonyl-CoA mutase N-terminal domain/subunit
MKLITDIFGYCTKKLPKWNTISISGYHIREAGSNAIEELAFTFANGIEYVKYAIDAGLNPNIFGKQISFFFNSHNHFFEEISKFRAARILWAEIMKNRFGVTDEKAMICKFHTQTAGSTLTAQDIDNNIIRTTLQATSAVIGGTQSLHTNSKDEALSLPTDKSAETALRTQQIIGYESGIPDVADPMAGSYYVEELTNQIIDRANQLINEIDELGGAIKAIENNFQQSMIAKSAYQYQIEIDQKDRIVVGVNDFKSDDKQMVEIQKIDKDAIDKQLNRLKKFKENRNEKVLQKALNTLKSTLDTNDNIMSDVVACVESNATLGEISDILRKKFGEYQG